ncbi:MAG: hypothetical protein PHC56_06600 [Herbinix sp.]|nr:hypothetical protein [Herbinix sp.]
MNHHYNQNYSIEQISKFLLILQDCVREEKYIISKNENRKENIEFIREYNLNSKRQKDIFLNIQPEDFCHSLQNKNIGFEHEVLYVFCPKVHLFNFEGVDEWTDIYLKFNLLETVSGNRLIVISFHKRNKSIEYLFK